jgi:hypothetical protein
MGPFGPTMQGPVVLAATALIHLFADAAGTIDLSDRTEVRGRSSQGVLPNPALDVANTATGQVNLTDRLWTFNLGYSASLLEADVAPAPAFMVMQFGNLGATWADRTVKLSIAEYGTYGLLNSATNGPLATLQPTAMQTQAPTAPPQGVQLLAAPAIIRFGASRTVLTATDRLGRRETFSAIVEYAMQGGLDPSSQAVLPFTQGPRFTADLAEALSGRHTLDVRLSLQHAETSAAPCSALIPPNLIAQLSLPCAPVTSIERGEATWGYRLSRQTDVSAGAGVAAVQVRLQDAQPGVDGALFPVGSASIVHVEPIGRMATTFRIDLAVGPFLNYLTGTVDERAQGTGSVLVPTHDVTYSGSFGATQSLTSTFVEPLTSLQIALGAEYAASRLVGLGGGFRYAWQQEQTVGTFSVATIYVALTLHPRQITF